MSVIIGIGCAKPRLFRRAQVTMRKMRVKETIMVVAAAFVVVHVQKRCLEKGKRQGQVHQDSSGKPHTHIVQSRQSRTPSLRLPFKEPYIPQVSCTSSPRLTLRQGGAPELP